MKLAHRIREYINQRHVLPARAAGQAELTIRAGDVHSDMGLVSRMPAVCQALEAKLFEEDYRVRLIRRTGPKQGANVFFTFAVGAGAGGRGAQSESSAPSPTGGGQRHDALSRTLAQETPTTLYLVSCVAEKLDHPAEARLLYSSDWFTKARAYVEGHNAPWFILSAEHGLLAPDTVVAPYERTLNAMSAEARRLWARRVIEQMQACLPQASQIIVLAGDRYREHLMEHLQSICADVRAPMKGLRIGEQLRWLKEAMAARGADPKRHLTGPTCL